MGRPFRVSVIGSGSCGPETEAKASRLGGLIASNGWLLVCGGRFGVQRAACKGAKDAGGTTLGVLPGLDQSEANEFVDFPVVTGLGQMRNFLVVKNGDVAVAVEGGAGTLSEIGLALKSGVPVIALGRWSGLEGVTPAASPEEAVDRILDLQARNKRNGHFVDVLWAPWRMNYIIGPKPDECVFCVPSHTGQDRERLILGRARHCYVIMNKFPYNSGHLMVTPYRHVSCLTELTPEEGHEMMEALQAVTAIMLEAFRPHGINAGLNLGEAAGAGIAQHLHFQVVPRWNGDNSFMAVFGQTHVIPELLEQTYDKLLPLFAKMPLFSGEESGK